MKFGKYEAEQTENSICGRRWWIGFKNGYGGSIITGAFAKGNVNFPYELAVLKDGHVCYDTPITNDVIGHLTADEVGEILEKIEALPRTKEKRKMINQEIEYIDENGQRILPADFDVKKAERIMENFLIYHGHLHTTFSEVVSYLILRGTGYDGGTSSCYLCYLFGVDSGDLATLKNWKKRTKR